MLNTHVYLRIRVFTYFAILCFPGFFQTTGPLSDSHRPGWIAVFFVCFYNEEQRFRGNAWNGYEKVLHLFPCSVLTITTS